MTRLFTVASIEILDSSGQTFGLKDRYLLRQSLLTALDNAANDVLDRHGIAQENKVTVRLDEIEIENEESTYE